MNKRQYRKKIMEIRHKELEAWLPKIKLECHKLIAEINTIKTNYNETKEVMKDIYKQCIEEVKKEKEGNNHE